MSKFIWRNGEYLPEDNKHGISIYDEGVIYGAVTFKSIRAYKGKSFRLAEHINRLKHLAQRLNITLNVSAKSFDQVVNRLLKLNNLEEACINIVLTRGITEPDKIHSNVIIEITAPPNYSKEREDGIKVITYPYCKNPDCPVSVYQGLNFLENRLIYLDAKKQGVFEAIRINPHKQEVIEGTQSNIFIIKGKRIYTPLRSSLNLPPQVTLDVISGICTKFRLKLRERTIRLSDIFDSDEVFLASPLMEIMPVVECDSQKIADGHPGFMSRSLYHDYHDML